MLCAHASGKRTAAWRCRHLSLAARIALADLHIVPVARLYGVTILELGGRGSLELCSVRSRAPCCRRR